MLLLRVTVPSRLSDEVVAQLSADPGVSGLSVMRGAALRPAGDLVLADVAREAADEVVDHLLKLGVHRHGTIHLEPLHTWVSREGYEAERRSPGASADSVVWPQVVQQAYEDSELNWTYASFMCLATLIAGIAIVLDSQVLVIGAMVLGPEFGAVAAMGVALVRRRFGLLRRAARTLVLGFVLAIALTGAMAIVGRATGWVTPADVVGPRPGTAFIYTPDRWSFLVAVIAAMAGVLSLTSSRVGGLSGVFISVTTVPAAGNVALGLAFGAWDEVRGSAAQLAVNLLGMAVAGWLTLVVQQKVWARVAARRAPATPPGPAAGRTPGR